MLCGVHPRHAVARAHVRGLAHAVQPAPEQPAKRAPLAPGDIPGVTKGFGGVVRAGAGAQALFSPGDRVTHKVFGAGTVLESNRDKIRIAFDTRGERTFPASIAPIRKIEG